MTAQFAYSPLLTDFYQLTMAYGYWQLGMQDQEAAFHLFFRSHPFQGKYTINCGLASVIEFLTNWKMQAEDIDYLSTLKDGQGVTFFSNTFLEYLSQLTFECDLDAIPEGTVVFPHTPLLRVQGPLLQCQLIESALLNMINFQTLIATKASRLCLAAQGDDVIEFGLRRAQGPDGALSASRAAYIGGCIATSNTLAGKLFDIPVRGTHAHSWVSAFPTEQAAFQAYASVMPHNCILLVDTYNTLQGIINAIAIGKRLRETGADLLGIRLDSGEMDSLSKIARKMLDDEGFKQTIIFASNSLDETIIHQLKQQQAPITAWGVGTNLVTAYSQPALDGVYKLSALKEKDGNWRHKLKLSEQKEKHSTPGRHQVRRFFINTSPAMDVIYDIDLGISDVSTVIGLTDKQIKRLDDYDASADLLAPVLRKGKLVQTQDTIHQIRQRAIEEVALFQTIADKASYPVTFEKQLFELKEALAAKYKNV